MIYGPQLPLRVIAPEQSWRESNMTRFLFSTPDPQGTNGVLCYGFFFGFSINRMNKPAIMIMSKRMILRFVDFR